MGQGSSVNSRILAIDPGEKTGWAILYDGRLTCSGLVKLGEFNEHIDPKGDFPVGPLAGGYSLIIEMPEVYPGGKVDPNDMIQLAVKVGRTRSYFGSCPADWIRPKSWKGQVPKPIHNKRVLSWLSPVESQIANKTLESLAAGVRDNVIDAIGLGIWYARKCRVRP